MLIATFVTMPDPSTFLAAVTAWSDPIFQGLLPVAEVMIAIIVGVGLIVLVVNLFHRVFGT